MVEMAVGEQDRHWLQPVLARKLVNPPLCVLARIDDDAFLTRRGRHEVAVGGERTGGKADDEHGGIRAGGRA